MTEFQFKGKIRKVGNSCMITVPMKYIKTHISIGQDCDVFITPLKDQCQANIEPEPELYILQAEPEIMIDDEPEQPEQKEDERDDTNQ